MKGVIFLLLIMSSVHAMDDQKVIKQFYETFSHSSIIHKNRLQQLLDAMKKILTDEAVGDHACKISQYDGLSTPRSVFCFNHLLHKRKVVFRAAPHITVAGLRNLIKYTELKTLEFLCEIDSFAQIVDSFCFYQGFDWLDEERSRYQEIIEQDTGKECPDCMIISSTERRVIVACDFHKQYLEALKQGERFKKAEDILLSIHHCHLSRDVFSTASESDDSDLSQGDFSTISVSSEYYDLSPDASSTTSESSVDWLYLE